MPKLVFPISRLLLNATMLVLSMGALFLVMVPLGAPVHAGSCCWCRWRWSCCAGFALGLGLIVAIVNTFYRDFGHLIVGRSSRPGTSPRRSSTRSRSLPEESRWRFWLNPAYPFIDIFQSSIYDGADWPLVGLGRLLRRDRGGRPGDRLCHVQVVRGQARLPPLIGPAAPGSAGAGAAGRSSCADVSLRFTTYNDKYYSLKRACIDLFLRRDSGDQHSSFWALQRPRPGGRPGRAGRHHRPQRRRQEHAAAGPGRHLPADRRHAPGRRPGRAADRDGRRLQLRAVGRGQRLPQRRPARLRPPADARRIDRIWEFSGLREFADLPLKYYSSGMLSRLAFAVATEVEPGHPAAGRDAQRRRRHLRRQGPRTDHGPDRQRQRRHHRLARHEGARPDLHPRDLARPRPDRPPTARSTRSSTSYLATSAVGHRRRGAARPADRPRPTRPERPRGADAAPPSGPARSTLEQVQGGTRTVRIGIDALAIQSPYSRGRGIGRYARSLLAALLDRDRSNDYVLYTYEDLPLDEACRPRPGPRSATVRRRHDRGEHTLQHAVERRRCSRTPTGSTGSSCSAPSRPGSSTACRHRPVGRAEDGGGRLRPDPLPLPGDLPRRRVGRPLVLRPPRGGSPATTCCWRSPRPPAATPSGCSACPTRRVVTIGTASDPTAPGDRPDAAARRRRARPPRDRPARSSSASAAATPARTSAA